MRVRIFQPSKSATQSGRAQTAEWLIEPELVTARTPDPVMGWASAGDTLGELRGRLKFENEQEAISFAEKQGWEFSVIKPKARIVQPRNYLDNFKWIRPQDEAEGEKSN
jgi:hypothetical protein